MKAAPILHFAAYLKDILPVPRELGRTGTGGTLPTLLSYAPNGESVVAIVVIGGVDIRGIDVQVVAIRTIVSRRGPPVAVATLIVRRAIVEVAGEGKISFLNFWR